MWNTFKLKAVELERDIFLRRETHRCFFFIMCIVEKKIRPMLHDVQIPNMKWIQHSIQECPNWNDFFLRRTRLILVDRSMAHIRLDKLLWYFARKNWLQYISYWQVCESTTYNFCKKVYKWIFYATSQSGMWYVCNHFIPHVYFRKYFCHIQKFEVQ